MSLLGFDAIGRLALGQMSGGGSIALVASPGSFAETGIASLFTITEAAPVTSYAVTVNAALFSIGLPGGVTNFAETGNAGILTTSLLSSTGQYVVTGLPATFSGSGAALGVGVYAVTGLSIQFGIATSTTSTSYVTAGSDAALDRDHIKWVQDPAPTSSWGAATLPSSVWTAAGTPTTSWTVDPAEEILPPEVH